MEEVAKIIKYNYGGVGIEIVKIRTTGDIDKVSPLYKIGGGGVFEKEVSKALLKGDIDLAVHSAKDVPYSSINYKDIIFVVPGRSSRADVFISRSGTGFWDLPSGGVVGSSSLRRQSYVRYFRRDLKVKNIRGNVDTRINKVMEGEYDAIILAEAGLRRLGKRIEYMRLPIDKFVPAAGQGALLVMARNEPRMDRLVGLLNDPVSYAEVMIEKLFVNLLGGGCRLPVGVTSIYDGERESVDVLAGVVNVKYSKLWIYRRSFELPRRYLLDEDYLSSISLDFYRYFIDGGGMDIVNGWWGHLE